MSDTLSERQFKRQKQPTLVRVSTLGSDEYQEARLIDIGEGGLCLESSVPIRTGTMLYVQVFDTHSDFLDLKTQKSFQCQVKWSRDLGDPHQTRYCMGLEFLHSMVLEDTSESK